MNASTHCPECHAELPADGFAGLCPRCVAKSLEDHLAQPAVLENRGERPVVTGWDVLEPVGAGGQGIVWRAVRLEDDVLGAVKVFRTQDLESAARMEAEAAALRRAWASAQAASPTLRRGQDPTDGHPAEVAGPGVDQQRDRGRQRGGIGHGERA